MMSNTKLIRQMEDIVYTGVLVAKNPNGAYATTLLSAFEAQITVARHVTAVETGRSWNHR